MSEMPIVILISQPTIDWHAFVNNVNQITSRSPTRLLDKQYGSTHNLPGFIASLGSLTNNLDFEQSLRYESPLLRHLSFGFLIHCNHKEYITLLRSQYLSIIDNVESNDESLVIICTSNLEEWRSAIYYFLDMQHTKRLRYIFNVIYLQLRAMGFEDIFIKYKKRTLNDQTFILEER